MTKPRLKFTVVIEQSDKGFYTASIPGSPGYQVEAEGLDELNARMTDMMQLFWEIDHKAKYAWTDASLGFIAFG